MSYEETKLVDKLVFHDCKRSALNTYKKTVANSIAEVTRRWKSLKSFAPPERMTEGVIGYHEEQY